MKLSVNTKQTQHPEGIPDVAQLAARIANGLVAKFDANQDGAITKDEFVKGMTVNGISAEKALAQFMAVDINGKGMVTKQDIQTAVKNGAFAGGARGGKGGGIGAMRLQAAAKTEDPAATDAAAQSALSAVDSPQIANAETDDNKAKSPSESSDSSDTSGAVLPSYKRTVGSQVDRYV
jgi:Ca2+-binding EF-hand superfamily protein